MKAYEEVLADLEFRRDELNSAIAVIKKLTGSFQGNGSDVAPGNDITEKRRKLRREANRSEAKLNRSAGGPIRAAATVNGKRPCNKCGETKPVKDFPTNKRCKDGHTGTCKECTRARSNASYAARKARQSSPPPRRTAKQSIDPLTLKVEAAREGFLDAEMVTTGSPGEPMTCRLCNSPCSTPERYRSHMKLVHKKEIAAA